MSQIFFVCILNDIMLEKSVIQEEYKKREQRSIKGMIMNGSS